MDGRIYHFLDRRRGEGGGEGREKEEGKRSRDERGRKGRRSRVRDEEKPVGLPSSLLLRTFSPKKSSRCSKKGRK